MSASSQIEIGFPYYFYGSEDSLDKDVVISIPKGYMPLQQEERKILLKQMELKYGFDWNAILAVIENGQVVDTIYPKSWVDTLNNSLFTTYALHEQFFSNPIHGLVPRNKLLAIYKSVRTVLTLLTRTHLRPQIRPIINGIHPFELKLAALQHVNWLEFEQFHQKNAKDVDIWKTVAFYIAQNVLLIERDIQIHTKKALINEFPKLDHFIYRKRIDLEDKEYLNTCTQHWIALIKNFGTYEFANGTLSCRHESIDTCNETFKIDC